MVAVNQKLTDIPMRYQTERFQQNKKRGRPKKVAGGTALVKPVELEEEESEEDEAPAPAPIPAKKTQIY